MKNLLVITLVSLLAYSTYSQDTKTEDSKTSYQSPMKEDIHPEYLRSMFLSPEQISAIRKTNTLWLDNLKIGLYVRPRYESRQNFDFNKTTDDYTNFIAQTT